MFPCANILEFSYIDSLNLNVSQNLQQSPEIEYTHLEIFTII